MRLRDTQPEILLNITANLLTSLPGLKCANALSNFHHHPLLSPLVSRLFWERRKVWEGKTGIPVPVTQSLPGFNSWETPQHQSEQLPVPRKGKDRFQKVLLFGKLRGRQGSDFCSYQDSGQKGNKFFFRHLWELLNMPPRMPELCGTRGHLGSLPEGARTFLMHKTTLGPYLQTQS